MTTATIGTISHGTMRAEDLIPNFASELESLCSDDTDKAAYKDLLAEAEAITDYESEAASYVLEGLFDALDAFSPPYCYFGAHEGDGSDYGFWPSFDSIECSVASGELVKLNAGDDLPADIEAGQAVMYVTDHGNVTMGYTKSVFVETWSCV